MKKETNNISRVLKKKNLRSLEPLRLSLGADYQTRTDDLLITKTLELKK
jgi:hypothetical protein